MAQPALAGSLCVGTGSVCYPTIQAAVNASHNGDTIVIDPGTYRGGVRIATSLRIQGSGGRQAHRDGGRGQQPGFAPQDGRSNNGIVAVLKVSPSAVEKYVTNIFAKLDLPPTGTDHRRVLAVLNYLGT